MKTLNAILIISFLCIIANAKAPNFLIVHLDDEDFVGQNYTDCVVNINSLLAKSLFLENFYSPTALEANVELLSGKYPANIKDVALGGDMQESEPCIAKSLKPLGYKSAYIGKWRNSKTGEATPNKLGFDFFYGVLDSDTKWPYDWQMKAALKGKLRAEDIKEPILNLFLNSNIIEVPANPNKFLPDFTKEALSFIDSSLEEEKPFFIYLNYACSYAKELALAKFFPSQKEVALKSYSAQLDLNFGKILKYLRRNEILEDTLIVFISNSFLKESLEPRENPQNLAPESKHKIPAFVYNTKRFNAPKSLDGVVCTLDVASVVLDSTKAIVPENSMLGYFLGLNACDQSPILYYSIYKEVFGMRDGNFKILLDKPKRDVLLQLYDLSKDPLEMHNLAESAPDQAQSLRKKAYALDSKQPKILNKEEQGKKEKYLKEKAKELEKEKKKALKELEKKSKGVTARQALL